VEYQNIYFQFKKTNKNLLNIFFLQVDPQTSITGASTPGGAAGYTPRALPVEEEAALLAADEKQFADQQEAENGVQVPPSPPGECSPTLMVFIFKVFKYFIC
jgi:hypothetical protein